MMTILYEVHDNIYVNMTNRCTCSCTFCVRGKQDSVGDADSLWLEHEPTVEEVVQEFSKIDMNRYNEVVFCGFGEPTERIDDLLKVAALIKSKYNKKIRINTNGQGSLSNGRNIVPEMAGIINSISVSLNTPNEEKYEEIVRSKFGKGAFKAMIEFTKEAKKYLKDVTMTTVSTTISKEDEIKCQQLCDKLGVHYRIRTYQE